jgi:hypothetical protein
MTTLQEKIEEYGQLLYDAGMDSASWDRGRNRDGKRTQAEAAALLKEIIADIESMQVLIPVTKL